MRTIVYRCHTTFSVFIQPNAVHLLQLINDGVLQRIQVLGGNKRIMLNLECWPSSGYAYSPIQWVPADVKAIYPRLDLRDRNSRATLKITNQNDFPFELSFVCRYLFQRSFNA